MALHVMDAGLDAAGKPVAWRQNIVCQSFMVNTPYEGAMIKDGVDLIAVEGAADLAYDIPNLFGELAPGPGRRPDALVALGGTFPQRLCHRKFCRRTGPGRRKRSCTTTAGPSWRSSRGTWESWSLRPRRPAGARRYPSAKAAAWPSMPRLAAMSPRSPKRQCRRKERSRSTASSAPSTAARW